MIFNFAGKRNMINNENKSYSRMRQSLWEIYSEIINEVLNFKNVRTCEIELTSEGWKFDAPIGNEIVTVWVYTESAPITDFKMNYKFPNTSKVFNFGFEIGSARATNQYQKTGFKDYIRILATVGKAFMQFISNDNPDIVTFFSDSKHSGHNPDPQKDNIYYAALENNLPNGYEIGDVFYDKTNKKGILLYKKTLIESKERKPSKVKLFINESDVENRLLNLKKNILYMAPKVDIKVKQLSESKVVRVIGKEYQINKLFEYFKESVDIKVNIKDEQQLIMNFPNRLFE